MVFFFLTRNLTRDPESNCRLAWLTEKFLGLFFYFTPSEIYLDQHIPSVHCGHSELSPGCLLQKFFFLTVLWHTSGCHCCGLSKLAQNEMAVSSAAQQTAFFNRSFTNSVGVSLDPSSLPSPLLCSEILVTFWKCKLAASLFPLVASQDFSSF